MATENTKRYKDKDWLERKYHVDRKSTEEIAEVCDCSSGTINYWLKKHNLGTRDRSEAAINRGLWQMSSIYTNAKGYEVLKTDYKNESYYVSIHRLLAIAKYGYSEVVGEDVHHKNGIPWDNREENIELVDHGDHRMKHDQSKKTNTKLNLEIAKKIREQYDDPKTTLKDLSERYDVTISAISHVVNYNSWNYDE